MRCLVVCHTHWDREWYHTFEAFRARLVDVVDAVLAHLARDPAFRFVLDGQAIVLEDYLAVRPERREALAAAVGAGRLAVGPWWVQPDSLLPSGETHVRNLLEGRRVASAFGAVSRVAYCPDSFGHPAQLPQLFHGFGLGPFVYWRGDGDATADLGPVWRWEAADGSAVVAVQLAEGYFAASGLPGDPEAGAAVLRAVAERLGAHAPQGTVLLPVGFDHAPPEPQAVAAVAALARGTGWDVRLGLLDDLAAGLPGDLPRRRGPLVGARLANLLPGVWSARLPLKLASRRAEAALEGWAEPWSAFGAALGLQDERPALRHAWRALLRNQAHDSIGGCSQDRVHEQMRARFAEAEELADATCARLLGRLAGQDVLRESPRGVGFDLAVFNPSPYPRTDVVRFPLEPDRWIAFRDDGGGRTLAVHPWLTASLTVEGVTADGVPARLLRDDATDRTRLVPERAPLALELVARDVPAFGWRRVRIEPAAAEADREDDGREIACDDRAVAVAADGTLAVRLGSRTWSGLAAVEDVGDRGDTYDADPVGEGVVACRSVRVRRGTHAGGIAWLRVTRALDVPAALAAERDRRADARASLVVDTEVVLAGGVPRVDLRVRVHNTVRDHRLRLRFPSGAAARDARAATTFDVAAWPTAPPHAQGWVHPAPRSFPQQGFVHANGLTVVAPGLPEAEVDPDGVIAITLVRAVGWLARMDLATRLQPAGPAVPTPGAQCLETIEARLALLSGLDPAGARAAELGLRAVPAGPAPSWPAGASLLEVLPREVLVSAVKPRDDGGPGVVVRLLNPTDDERRTAVVFGLDLARVAPLRLDETPADDPTLAVHGRRVTLVVPPHALRTLGVTLARGTDAALR